MSASSTIDAVKEYYGQILQSGRDLQTSACCPVDALPAYLRPIEAELHPEVRERFYGCGSPIPLVLEGQTVLDLGCGSGRDTYLLSKLVGVHGRVIGIDMTAEQLAVAARHRDYHAQKFGYATSNVQLIHGYIEDLAAAGIATESIDVVISNCVINLSPDKPRLFAEIFRVLKPGGELYFSDVFASRRVPPQLLADRRLVGECLAGALYYEDFRRLLRRVGCLDVRTVRSSPIQLLSPDIEQQIGMVAFQSKTVRAFKLDLEDLCEDYGQVASYLGTIPSCPHQFVLDDHHLFRSGQPVLVCGNSAAMLSDTRYRPHFRVSGDRSVHYGPFACATPPATTSSTAACC